jgi:hypothetical protein
MGETEAKDRKSKKRLSASSWWVALVMGIIVGAFALIAVRFITFKDTTVHYHANFALYVNGKRDEFKGPGFYEEIAACSTHDVNDVKARVHMHDENNHLIHVHANGVTWSEFFANLGYTFGNTVLTTGDGTFVDGQNDNHLTFTLNGNQEFDIANRVIKSEDVLLINYGNDSAAALKQRYDAIPRDAHEANTKADPSSCSGSHKLTFTERLKHSTGFGE